MHGLHVARPRGVRLDIAAEVLHERTIDAHVKNLRRKIEPDARRPRYVLTVYGVGYRLADDRPEDAA